MPLQLRTYDNWNHRVTDELDEIEPYKRYIFLCEGIRTEIYYFDYLISIRKKLGIDQSIELCIAEKTGKDSGASYPKNMLALARESIKNMGDTFDNERDKMIIVFDGDVFEEKVKGYDELISAMEDENFIPGVTNPNFELFLLLHIAKSYEEYIENKEELFLQKDKENSYSYAYKMLREVTEMNAKKNRRIGRLAENILVAIEQESKLNQDIHQIKGKVSSNIGLIIDTILKERVSVNH